VKKVGSGEAAAGKHADARGKALKPSAFSPASIASPCIKICRIEGEVCAGCARTLDEIARWSQMSAAEKRQVLAAVAERTANQGQQAARS
jgi:predicted Fe-S protein YdhL (DUF1289 family)